MVHSHESVAIYGYVHDKQCIIIILAKKVNDEEWNVAKNKNITPGYTNCMSAAVEPGTK